MKELEFYLKKINFLRDCDEINLDFVPPIVRRRMSLLDKVTFSTLNNTYTEDVQNIVFSSQYGEVEKLLKIIAQYTENKEVSPNAFSGSVHNYPIGSFLFNKKKAIPYNALSACENSISAGLLTAVISKYDNILFCYADSNKGVTKSLAANLTKNETFGLDKCKLIVENNAEFDESFESFAKFFDGNKKVLKTSLYTVERVSE